MCDSVNLIGVGYGSIVGWLVKEVHELPSDCTTETINCEILREGWGLMNPPLTGNFIWDFLVILDQYEENVHFYTMDHLDL